MPVAQHIVGACTVFQHHLITNAEAVGKTPILRGKLAVNNDAGKGFVGGLHGVGGYHSTAEVWIGQNQKANPVFAS